jgi:hypothetical protein
MKLNTENQVQDLGPELNRLGVPKMGEIWSVFIRKSKVEKGCIYLGYRRDASITTQFSHSL